MSSYQNDSPGNVKRQDEDPSVLPGSSTTRAGRMQEGFDAALRRVSESTPIRLITGSRPTSSYGGIGFSDDVDGSPVSHCHTNNESTSRGVDKKARQKLLIASGLCLAFMLGEAIGGILANSLAIATDAAHLLTDFASFMISLVAIHLASRPATKRMSFGWYRAEVMGAVISVIMIWIVTSLLVFMAVERVTSKDFEINASVMLITAAVGVGVNLIMGVALHDTHGHSHGGGGGSSHGHSHGGGGSRGNNSQTDCKKPLLQQEVSGYENDHTVVELSGQSGEHSHKSCEGESSRSRSTSNINVRAAFIHVIGDLFQSIGVLVAAFIIYFKPEWKIADPICTFLFSILVLFTTINILKDAFRVLMEGTPKGISFNEVKECLCEIGGVRELHNLRIWSLTLEKAAISVHLAVDAEADTNKILSKANELMRDKYDIEECTVQVELYTQAMDNCTQCQDPCD